LGKRFSEGLAIVQINGKDGFIDIQGNIVIKLLMMQHILFRRSCSSSNQW